MPSAHVETQSSDDTYLAADVTVADEDDDLHFSNVFRGEDNVQFSDLTADETACLLAVADRIEWWLAGQYEKEQAYLGRHGL